MITPGLGKDRVTPGAGADTIRYIAPGEGGDTIFGFDATDKLTFRKAAFANVAAITAANYVENNTGLATKLSHRFIFERDTDTLWFDANGSKTGLHFAIAKLPGVNHLAADDFSFFA